MFNFKPKCNTSELELRIKELEQANEKLTYAAKVYKERLDSEFAEASFAVDWHAMNAFSIERVWDNGVHKTVIGYLLPEPITVTEGNVTTKDTVREWNLSCSHKEHQRLVAEFNEYVKGKQQ